MSDTSTKLCARCGKIEFDLLHNKEANDADPETHRFIENIAPREVDMADLLYIGQLLATRAKDEGACYLCEIEKNGGCHEWHCPMFGLDPKVGYDDLEEQVEEVNEALYGEDEDEGCGREDCTDCNPLGTDKKKPPLAN
jgi:hypothetical protein